MLQCVFCKEWTSLHVFFISNSIFGVNVRLLSKFMFSMSQVALELLSIFLFDRPGMDNFCIVTSISPKYYCTRRIVLRKFSFNELKIEKVNFFTQSPTKIFCTRVFNVGGCLASCLTFRPFLTLDLKQLGCLLKKNTCMVKSTFKLFD